MLILFVRIRERKSFGLHIQQLYKIGCDWTDNGHIVLHQDANVLNNSMHIVTNVTQLKTINNVQIHSLLL